jgi:hypothetical protein
MIALWLFDGILCKKMRPQGLIGIQPQGGLSELPGIAPQAGPRNTTARCRERDTAGRIIAGRIPVSRGEANAGDDGQWPGLGVFRQDDGGTEELGLERHLAQVLDRPPVGA